MARRATVVAMMLGAWLTADLPALHGQAAPTFDVASIKPNNSASTASTSLPTPPGRISMVNMSVAALIARAYRGAGGPQGVLGLPTWAQSERFDVEARMTPSATREEIAQMWQTLLADRMKLIARYETRDEASYNLVVNRADRRLGPKLMATSLDCRTSGVPSAEQPTASVAASRCGVLATRLGIASGSISIAGLALLLRTPLERPVVDRTGLEGAYSVDLRFVPPGDPAADADTTDIFTALREQLGLRVEPSRTSVTVVVVDRIERPTAN